MPPQKRRQITLKQVAEQAGVHVSTASRALNADTRSMVVSAVAERVIATANQLGYRADPVAASLRTGRSKLVGILAPDISNTVFGSILSGASERLAATGYTVIVADVGNDTDRQLELAARLFARRVDGLILATARQHDPVVDFCLQRHCPAILVNRAEVQARLSTVVSDDEHGMQLAVDHLVSLGHRKIGHIAGPAEHSTGYRRRRGFARAMAKHELTKRASYQVTKAYSREEGAAAARRLFDTMPSVSAIVAANDLLALGVYDTMHERGLKCPRDVSVVGHNDMPLVDMVEPPLTTVRIGHREMGRQAAELLRQAIESVDPLTQSIVLRPVLIVRQSTAPLQPTIAKSRKHL